jgi:5-methylcytosine-specific restriction endonuclease McrA
MNFDATAYLDDCAKLTREELLDRFMNGLIEVSVIVATRDLYIRSKPLLGGMFGSGNYHLCSTAYALSGLDRVEYFVMAKDTELVLSCLEPTPAAAIASARDVLASIATPNQIAFSGAKAKQVIAEARKKKESDRKAKWASQLQGPVTQPEAVKSISRRRRQIFDEGDGKCHYCATPLTLTGRWHVEHKMPKALGGGNEPGNLVASCAPCNHAKRDTTDIEFKAKLARSLA